MNLSIVEEIAAGETRVAGIPEPFANRCTPSWPWPKKTVTELAAALKAE